MAPSIGAKKLGHPVPLSNFRSATKSGCWHPAQANVPGLCSASSAHDPGNSVPWPRRTAYCSGVSRRFHSSSVLVTGNVSFFITVLGKCTERNTMFLNGTPLSDTAPDYPTELEEIEGSVPPEAG